MARIIVLDCESTGEVPAGESVIELGWVDVFSNSKDLAGGPIDWQVGEPQSRLVGPAREISPEAQAVHYIAPRDLAGAGSWFDALSEALHYPDIVALAAHGAEFEAKFITDELTGGLPLVCTYKAALRRYPEAPKHSNGVLRFWRNPEGLLRELAEPTHRAGPDAYVTAFLLRDMLNNGVTVEQMIAWTKEPALLARCYIGEYRREGKGTPWSEVEEGYLEWILSKDFKEDVVHTVKVELGRREKEREKEMEQRELTYVDDV